MIDRENTKVAVKDLLNEIALLVKDVPEVTYKEYSGFGNDYASPWSERRAMWDSEEITDVQRTNHFLAYVKNYVVNVLENERNAAEFEDQYYNSACY